MNIDCKENYKHSIHLFLNRLFIVITEIENMKYVFLSSCTFQKHWQTSHDKHNDIDPCRIYFVIGKDTLHLLSSNEHAVSFLLKGILCDLFIFTYWVS